MLDIFKWRGTPGHASNGAIFQGHMSVSLGCFSTYIGVQSLIYAELFPVILAMESSLERNWRKVWFECDSILVMEAFKNPSLVPWRLRRHWKNCLFL
ncbi:hypothetical protein HKD37_18G049772 [Glycine soja]